MFRLIIILYICAGFLGLWAIITIILINIKLKRIIHLMEIKLND